MNAEEISQQAAKNAEKTVNLLFDKSIYVDGVKYCHIDSVTAAIDHIHECSKQALK